MTRFLSAIILLALAGCDLYEQDSYTEQYVVETFLIAGEPFPEILLSTTVPIDQFYDFSEQAVNGANIRVYRLNEDGVRLQTIQYVESNQPGVYLSISSTPIVQPATRYQLEITSLPDPGARIRSETFVPGAFEVVSKNADSLPYQGPEQFEIELTRSTYPGRQNIYIFSTEAADTSGPRTPFYADIDELSFQRVSSGLINEGNYQINPGGTITLRYPWIGVAYFGENTITAYAVDDNIYDFFRSADVQLGGSTLSPGQIENVLYNIQGGIGIFGSMSGVSEHIFVLQPTVRQ